MDIRAAVSRACVAAGGQADLARLLGVTPAAVNQWCKGLRPIPAERCVDIERATAHSVMRWDLRPDDWHRIWPELIGADGAPAVAEPVRAEG